MSMKNQNVPRQRNRPPSPSESSTPETNNGTDAATASVARPVVVTGDSPATLNLVELKKKDLAELLKVKAIKLLPGKGRNVSYELDLH